jgi:carbon-monoxide dehydrogenase medium subunit
MDCIDNYRLTKENAVVAFKGKIANRTQNTATCLQVMMSADERDEMKPFEYHEPGTIREVVQLLSSLDEDAQVLAGGIDLIPRMRRNIIDAIHVISIRKVAGLGHIYQDSQGMVVFGAMVTLRALESSDLIRSSFPILYESIHQLTSVQAKCMGTAVGNLCLATPASDIATALMALAARVRVAGPGGERTQRLEEFYLDYHRTSLKRGEFVTEVIVPPPAAGNGTGFLNLVKTRADIAKLIVGVSVVADGDVCREARIVIGAAAPTVFRTKNAEAFLAGQKIGSQAIEEAAVAAAAVVKPITDIRSTAEYRKEVTRVLVGRALIRAFQRAERKARSAAL